MELITNSIFNIFSMRPLASVIKRQFITLDGIGPYGDIPTWTVGANEGFTYEADFVWNTGTSHYLIGNADDYSSYVAIRTTPDLHVRLGTGTVQVYTVPSSLYQDGKLHHIKVSRPAGSGVVTVELDGITYSENTGQTRDAGFSFSSINNVGGTIVGGVPANISLTQTAGGDNRFYPMDGGRYGVGAYELDSEAVSPPIVGDWTPSGTWADNGDGSFTGSGAWLTFDNNGVQQAVMTFTLESGAMRIAQGGSYISDIYSTPGTFTILATDLTDLRIDGITGCTISNLSVTTAPTAMQLISTTESMWEEFTQDGADWLGGELVVNGGFDTDTEWAKSGLWTISGGTANSTNVGGFDIRQGGLLTSGYTYKGLSETVTSTAGVLRMLDGASGIVADISAVGGNEFIYTAAGDRVNFICGSGGFTGSIDNVSVKRILQGV